MKKFLIVIVIFFTAILSFWIYLNHNTEFPILMYHSLDPQRTDTYAAVSPEIFEKQIRYIKERGYNVIDLQDYCALLRDSKKIPKKSLAITFDDGHKDNVEAVRILKKYGLGATIFVIANKIGEPGYLRHQDIRDFLKTSKVKIGAHTLNEVYLPDADDQDLKQEIKGAKDKLSQLFGQEINTMSYTIGGFDQRAIEEVKQSGYLCACTTNRGFYKEVNRFALRRIKVTNKDNNFKLWAKLTGIYNYFRKVKKPN